MTTLGRDHEIQRVPSSRISSTTHSLTPATAHDDDDDLPRMTKLLLDISVASVLERRCKKHSDLYLSLPWIVIRLDGTERAAMYQGRVR